MRRLTRLACVFGGILFAVMSAMTVEADEITLENGNVITGKVTKLEKGVLTVTTAFSEPISLKAANVRRIATDEAVEVHLSTGEVIKGRISSPEPGQAVVEPVDGRGAVPISWDRIESLNPPIQRVKWTGNVTLGANSQSGNTDRTSVSLGAEASRKSETDRAGFKLLYNYAEENGELTARNIYGSLKYDYFFTKKFYGYMSVEMLSDRFRDIRLRTIAGPGVGYQVWDDKVKSLLLELGIAYFSEDLYTGNDDSWATSREAASFVWRFTDHLNFSDSIVANNRLDDPSDCQVRNEAAINTGLGAAWALKVANIIEYDSKPAAGIKKTDAFWIIGLQYSF